MTERDADKVTRHLRDAILRLEYRPGQTLDEADLSETLNVSRTPIREALIHLIADGLVIRDGRRARVAPLDIDDMPKLYDALLISSRMIQRLAAQHRTPGDLDAMAKARDAFEDAVRAGNGVARSETNQQFHLVISRAADNRYFQEFYEQVLMSTIRLARACFSAAPDPDATPDPTLDAHLRETMRQHRLIHDAIAEGNPDKADALAVAHHKLTRDRVQTILFSGAFDGERLPDLEIPETT